MNFLYSLGPFLVPTAIFLFLLLKIRQSKANLGILSLFVLLGRGAYLNTYGKSLLGRTIPIFDTDIAIILLFFCVKYFRHRRNRIPRKFSNPILTCSCIIMIFIGLEIILSWESHPSLFLHTLRHAKLVLWFPISIFLWEDYFSRLSMQEILCFFKTITYITLPLSVLYILSSVGFPVYPYEPYAQYYIDGQWVVRDFFTIPTFLNVAFCYTMVSFSNRIFQLFSLVILGSAALATSTRWVIFSFILSAIVSIYILHRGKTTKKQGFRTLNSIILLIIMTWVISTVALPSFEFALNRITEFGQKGISTPNLQYRIEMLEFIAAQAKQPSGSVLLGGGFILNVDEPIGQEMIVSADSMWSQTISRFGIVGTFVYALLSLVSLIQLIRIKVLRQSILVYCIVIQLIFIAIVSTVFSSGYLPSGVVGAIPFGLLASLVSRQTHQRHTGFSTNEEFA